MDVVVWELYPGLTAEEVLIGTRFTGFTSTKVQILAQLGESCVWG
jgi:hypothetical protein